MKINKIIILESVHTNQPWLNKGNPINNKNRQALADKINLLRYKRDENRKIPGNEHIANTFDNEARSLSQTGSNYGVSNERKNNNKNDYYYNLKNNPRFIQSSKS